MEKLLILVDFQNDFIDGALGTKEAKAIVPKVIEKVKSYSPKDIIYSVDSHNSRTGRGIHDATIEEKNLPPHCEFYTQGWLIEPNVYNLIKDHATRNIKEEFAFLDLDFLLRLRIRKKIDKKEEYMWKFLFGGYFEIEIVGLCTDVCVISTALYLRSLLPTTKITVDSSCCAGTTPEKHKAALEVMESCLIEVK